LSVTLSLKVKYSAKKLEEAFERFIEGKVDISAISKLDSVFETPPTVDEDNVLHLSGHYQTEGKRVVFELEYEWVSAAWKLRRIDVSIE